MTMKVRSIEDGNKNDINVNRKSKRDKKICTLCACIAEDKYQSE